MGGNIVENNKQWESYKYRVAGSEIYLWSLLDYWENTGDKNYSSAWDMINKDSDYIEMARIYALMVKEAGLIDGDEGILNILRGEELALNKVEKIRVFLVEFFTTYEIVVNIGCLFIGYTDFCDLEKDDFKEVALLTHIGSDREIVARAEKVWKLRNRINVIAHKLNYERLK